MKTFDLRTIYAEVRRFWWLPTITVLAGLATAAWLNSREPTHYRSTAKMVVAGKMNLGMGAAYQENSEDFLGTQAAIIQGDVVARRAQTILADQSLTHPKSAVGIHATFVPQTAIFELSATGTDPVYTQATLQATMQGFFEVRQDIRRQRSESASAAVSREIARVQPELDGATQELNDFQRQFSTMSPLDDITATTAYLNTLRQKIADLQLGRSGSSTGSGTDPSTAAAAIPLDSGSIGGAGQNDAGQDRLAATQEELAVLEAERERMLKRLKPAHPKVRQLESRIAEDRNHLTVLKSQQRDHRNDQIASIDRERAALEEEVEQKQAHLEDLNKNLSKYQNLKSKVDSSRNAYNQLVSQLQSIDVGQRLEQEPIAILENAGEATRVAKSPVTNFLKFGLLGLGLGLGGLFIGSRLAPRFTTIEAVTRTLNLPVVGKILRDPWISKQRTVLDCTPKHVGIAESFRHLRSSILRRPQDSLAMQCLAVTSAVPREGKSLVAANLAIALAATNARTLLIDGDMRRGKLHQLFGVASGPGLSDLLTRQKGLPGAVQETRMPHLYLMSCGQRIQNITEHLLSFGLNDLRRELNSRFDYILIDTPPVLATDDSVALAAYADTTLFVVRLGLSRPQDALTAMAELKLRRIQVSGVVVNSVPKRFIGRRFYGYQNLLEDRPFRGYNGQEPALPA
ncbi:MAG TPA: polysaccharide biosynthesis tyrosine autokinase [Chthoniobacterales bacterium]|nr:polysaccharide biosynthesis tyrosine autokinase [Chthoniobacterales bacterium]